MVDHGTYEEDGSVTWDTQASPRGVYGLRRPEPESPTDLAFCGCTRDPAKKTDTRDEVGQRRGEPEPRPKGVRESEGRLIGKCLHVGVLEHGAIVSPETGTVQGSTLSPLLANVYLHHVLDLWFEQDVKPRLRAGAILIRYCDDFVIGFERQDDAVRVERALNKRLARFGLELHPEKTRLVEFRRPPKNYTGKRPDTFDLLGFTVLWKRSRRGNWHFGLHTRRSRLRRTRKSIYDWCRRQRHQPIQVQHAALVRRIQGHFNYFGVRGNERRLHLLVHATKRAWFKWLNRRSQRSTLTWDRFLALLGEYPLPDPRARWWLWRQAL